MSALFAFLLLLTQAVAAPSQNVSPTNVSPAKPPVQPTPDPASALFTTPVGIMLVAIKPASVPDYELVIRTLQEALAKDTDENRRTAAKGWFVYRVAEADAKGNALYVHLISPVVPAFDYRPSLLVDELVNDLAPELLSRYQQAFATPPTRLSLTEFANMSVMPAPATPPATTPTPAAKPPDKKPGGG